MEYGGRVVDEAILFGLGLVGAIVLILCGISGGMLLVMTGWVSVEAVFTAGGICFIGAIVALIMVRGLLKVLHG